MSLEIILILGVIFNIVIFLLTKGFRSHITGIDSMPAVTIIAGILYGPSAGITTGFVVSIIYYFFHPGRFHYAPLTIVLNIMVGILAPFLGFLGIFGAGLILLILYHAISLAIVSILGGVRPGYFTFMILNVFTTFLILLLASPLK